MISIRAIYRDGQLQLLDPVDLNEGQEVRLQIVSDARNRVREALSDMLIQSAAGRSSILDFDENVLQHRIDAATQDITLSDLIIEDRHTGR